MRASALLTLLVFISVTCGATAAPQEPARMLVHLLAYVGADYGVAVKDGKILSPDEYKEQKEFLKTAVEAMQEVPVLLQDAQFQMDMARLRSLVDKLGSPEEVGTVAQSMSARALKLTGLDTSPTRWPNLAHGKDIYDRTCAQCHGVNGRGDGPSSGGLEPAPTDFHSEKMADISPFQAFNTIRLGVPGTAMAAFSGLTDAEVWDLAFYVERFRHGEVGDGYRAPKALSKITLTESATLTDAQLLAKLPGTAAERAALLSNVRLQSSTPGDTASLVGLTRERLHEARRLAAAGDWKAAKSAAVTAYLDGVEPLEPRLRAKDMSLVASLEQAMADVRGAIDARATDDKIALAVAAAETELTRTAEALAERSLAPSFTFSVAFGIVLREAFEAVLVIITLLGVLRAMGLRSAILYVHGGWMLACAVGLVTWYFSGWLVAISGAQREVLEGTISIVAVLVLLYFGFWLHRRTEIGKWRAFINDMVKTAVDGKRLMVLGTVAFMAVFREAFETVLFLRALLVEAGPHQQGVLGAAVVSAFLLVLILAALVVRYSVKIPVRQLFAFSSFVMVVLAVILVGKGVHSFQETGLLSVTALPLRLRIDLLGLYPTYETFVPQLVIVGVSVAMWAYGRRMMRLRERPA